MKWKRAEPLRKPDQLFPTIRLMVYRTAARLTGDDKNNRGCFEAAPVVCCFVYFFLFLARDLPSDWPFLKLACIF